jgi:hypothetical protein
LNKVNLFSVDRAKQLATKLGFQNTPEELSDVDFRWKKASPIPSTLEMDIVSRNFEKKVDWASDPTYLAKKDLPGQAAAVTEAKTLLRLLDLYKDDVATGEARVSYLRASGSSYTSVLSLSEADFVQVDVFRTPINNQYQILRTKPKEGNMRIIFSGKNTKEDRVVGMKVSYFPIDYETYETYPLITAAEAWQLLQAGRGYVAQLEKGVTEVVVRNVELIYYDSETPQHYLQPVYMFTGDKNFVGYVPAVRPPNSSNSSSN